MQRITRFFRLLLSLILLTVVVIFAASNSRGVELSLFPIPYAVTLPLALILISMFMIGVIVCGLASSMKHHRLKREIAQQNHRNHALQSELEAVKDRAALPGIAAMPPFPAVLKKK